MSKTVEIQIEKSRGLVEGLRRHVKEMGERGVTNDEINAMEQAVKELEAVNAEVDSIREQLTPTVAKLKVAMDRPSGALDGLRRARQAIIVIEQRIRERLLSCSLLCIEL